MAEGRLSLWLQPPDAGELGAELVALDRPAVPPDEVSLELRNEAGQRLGEPVTIAVPQAERVEVPSGDAGFDWTETVPPLSLDMEEIPREAVSVVASAGGVAFAELPLRVARARAPRPPDHVHSINPAGRWRVLLVSDMFADRQAFVDACNALHAFIVGEPPFADPTVAASFGIDGLHWADARSLFNVRVNGRLVSGDNDLVRRFVEASGREGQMIVVLVNMNVRGGAGGTRRRPAWVTTKSDPAEQWEAVALHELGHSFGLADEYSDASQPTPEPDPLEPNVTASRRGAEAPWAALCTPGMEHNPTQNALGQPAGPFVGTIGTFEGARYQREGRFRSSLNCLMRTTARNTHFCRVCQMHIRRVVTA